MKTITLTRPAPYQCEGVTLLPGKNEVSEQDIARLTRNKIVRRDIDAGILIIGHGNAAPAPAPAPEAEPAPVPDDMEALRELAEGDGRRKDVQEARAKLAELEGESEE